jgi:hypothetical protein
MFSGLARRLRRAPAAKSSPDRRRWLLERMPEGSVCAEIGVWKGDFSEAVLREVQPRTLHLVDPWRAVDDREHEGAMYQTDQPAMDAVHEGVCARFAAEIAAGRVIVHRTPSLDAAGAIPDETLDWVYIDGDHLYEAVRADLAAWTPKVVSGGFVCGDDYGKGGWWEGGVKRAVDEVVDRGELELVIQARRQFILRRPTRPPGRTSP